MGWGGVSGAVTAGAGTAEPGTVSTGNSRTPLSVPNPGGKAFVNGSSMKPTSFVANPSTPTPAPAPTITPPAPSARPLAGSSILRAGKTGPINGLIRPPALFSTGTTFTSVDRPTTALEVKRLVDGPTTIARPSLIGCPGGLFVGTAK